MTIMKGKKHISDNQHKKPNLIIVFADQMRYMDMGCAGNEQIKTPNLDKLAEQGAFFTNAVSTCAVCGPHRAMMFTGMYPLSNTVFTNNIRLPDDIPSMGKILKEQGWRTAYIGKWHLAGEPAEQGYVPPGAGRHGFDYWAVHNCSHQYYDSIYYRDSPDPIVMKGWQPDEQTGLALEYIKKHAEQSDNNDEPFAMVMSLGTPHTPFIAPPEYKALYPPENIRLRENVPENNLYNCLHVSDSPIPPMFKEWWNKNKNQPGNPRFREPELILREFISNYYGAITNIDYNMGRIMAGLKKHGIDNETIVVFTSDHGEMLGSHGHLHKWQPWEESIKVPFIVRYPGKVPEKTRIAAPFGSPDILPTLLSLMGINTPNSVEGDDFSALLQTRDNTKLKERASALILCVCAATTWGRKWTWSGRGMPGDFFRPYRGVRTQRHTYVRDHNGPWFLYDNEQDPFQLNNLVETAGKSAIPSELDKEIEYWLERTNDFFGHNEDYQKLVDLNTGTVLDRDGLTRKN